MRIDAAYEGIGDVRNGRNADVGTGSVVQWLSRRTAITMMHPRSDGASARNFRSERHFAVARAAPIVQLRNA
jgi:hypothetical protein